MNPPQISPECLMNVCKIKLSLKTKDSVFFFVVSLVSLYFYHHYYLLATYVLHKKSVYYFCLFLTLFKKTFI